MTYLVKLSEKTAATFLEVLVQLLATPYFTNAFPLSFVQYFPLNLGQL
jgi:hypothetical protein